MAGLFGTVARRSPDPILTVTELFRADPRPDKLDIGVGVYRDAAGNTPVFAAVREAEARIFAAQTTKSYTSIAGDPAFHRCFGDLVLGPEADWNRLAAIATPGGTGALHQGAVFLQALRPGATVWLPQPSWANHAPLMTHAGLRVQPCRYFDATSGTVLAEAMLADLAAVQPGDVILLQGCCHNPTGADPGAELWTALADLCAERQAIPFLDVAYQGLGVGIAQDLQGVREVLRRVPEALVSVSGSKNFGLYRDRVGLLLAQCAPVDRNPVQDALVWLNRLNYTFPPDHGARIVTEVLGDDVLRHGWTDELDAMRNRLVALRGALAKELRQRLNSPRFEAITQGKGMFAMLPLSEAQVAQLRSRHGIYLVPDGRINIAGLDETSIPRLANALAEIGLNQAGISS